MTVLKLNEVHWIAGLLEGEASFHGDDHTSLVIQLRMTDEDIVSRAAKVLGVAYRATNDKKKKAHHKDTFRLYVCGAKAAAWMMTLWPLMGQRRKQRITAALTVWRTRRISHRKLTHCKHGHKLSDDNVYHFGSGNRRKFRVCRTCHNKRVRKKTNGTEIE